jgi:hypothetical protein
MPVRRILAADLTPEQARALADCSGVLAVDPGADGAMATRPIPDLAPWLVALEDYAENFGVVDCSQQVVLLLEDQFIGKGAHASLEVSWYAGAVAGWWMRAAPNLTIVHVAPSTWQARQRERLGIARQRKAAKLPARVSRAEGIAIAMEELTSIFPNTPQSGRKAQREGKASALGILLWFEDLCSTGPLVR